MDVRLSGAMLLLAVALALAGLPAIEAHAQSASDAPLQPASEAPPPTSPAGPIAFHAQSTFVAQANDGFRSPYVGPNSLDPKATARETWDVTLFGGVRPWRGGELWIDPEVDQGFGLDRTVGVAGFPSGEAYKVGAATPYVRIQRIFVRQTVNLSGASENAPPDQNQFGGEQSANRLVFTAGKFSVVDVFDTNAYAHDPRGDFMNWTLIDAGTFDYAADSWGYTAGAALEWYQAFWTLRTGAFLLSNVPNSPNIDTRFDQFQLIEEAEARYRLFGAAGKVKVTGFLSRGRMARLDDAVALALQTGGPPDLAAVRRYASRPGVSVNLEQPLTDDLGAFARAGWANGAYETYEFTDVDRSVSGGLSLAGRRWGRPDDRLGLAGVVNEASDARIRFLNVGGLGLLVGDGQLPHPGTERIVETYYDLAAAEGAALTLDYQWITNPGYNRDRGPVSVLAVRLHGQF